MAQLFPARLRSRLPSIECYMLTQSIDSLIYVHYFNPIGEGAWYVVAGDELEDDYVFYGFIQAEVTVKGFFTLSELKKMKLPFGTKIIRNGEFRPMSIRQALGERFR